jgi:hypothetical protein
MSAFSATRQTVSGRPVQVIVFADEHHAAHHNHVENVAHLVCVEKMRSSSHTFSNTWSNASTMARAAREASYECIDAAAAVDRNVNKSSITLMPL